jgi:hypothetical protein
MIPSERSLLLITFKDGSSSTSSLRIDPSDNLILNMIEAVLRPINNTIAIEIKI